MAALTYTLLYHLATLSYFDFVHSHWYIPFLHSHITFFLLFHLSYSGGLYAAFFIVFLCFYVIRLVFYFAGTSQTLTPPSHCTFIQVGFHLKPPHLYIFTIFVNFPIYPMPPHLYIFTSFVNFPIYPMYMYYLSFLPTFTLPILLFMLLLISMYSGLGYIHT